MSRMVEGIFFKFGMCPFLNTFIVNLVPFGLDVAEQHMRENCDFVLPVNILIMVLHTPLDLATHYFMS